MREQTTLGGGCFCHSPRQELEAKEAIAALDASEIWGAPAVTRVEPLEHFYRAEEEHQGYYRANPNQGYCMAVVAPKVAKARTRFLHRLRL